MRTERQKQRPSRKSARTHHSHSKAFCLKVLRHLSAYVDDELPKDICREIRIHLGACPNCEVFLESLRQTVSLCRHAPSSPLSPTARERIRGEILRTIGAR